MCIGRPPGLFIKCLVTTEYGRTVALRTSLFVRSLKIVTQLRIIQCYRCGTPLSPNSSHPTGLAQRTAQKISTDAPAACDALTQIRPQHDPLDVDKSSLNSALNLYETPMKIVYSCIELSYTALAESRNKTTTSVLKY